MLNTRRVVNAEIQAAQLRKVALADKIVNAAHNGYSTNAHEELAALDVRLNILAAINVALTQDEATTKQLTWAEAR